MQYANPVIPGFYPDPSVCRVGDDFYLVTSSFEYFPGLPIFRSKNLVDWEQIGHCLTRESQLPLAGATISSGIYAPTLRYHDGRFYVVTTNVTAEPHLYVSTDDPAGEWPEPVWLDWVNQRGIAPDFFWDEDGSVIFSCTGGGKGIAQRRIDLEKQTCLSESVLTWTGTGGKCPEAPHVYLVDGCYYLLIAEGGTEYGHCVTIARGPGPMGPWESCPHNPILTHRSINNGIHATGHGDLVQDPRGNWWMVCLGIRPRGFHLCHVLGRETFLAPVRWEEGWPIVGDDGRLALAMQGPEGLPVQSNQEPESVRDDFDADRLGLCWNFLGNPVAENWSLGANPGRLTLRCAEANLGVMEGQAWVGRRQQHHRFRVLTEMDFLPMQDGEEAGLTVFQNIHHHYEVAVVRRGGSPCVLVRRTIGTLTAEVARAVLPGMPLTLLIEGDEETYRLGYLEGREVVVLAEGEMRYLSTEVGGRFTGVYLAMYATANGQPSLNTAQFDWFDYRRMTE